MFVIWHLIQQKAINFILPCFPIYSGNSIQPLQLPLGVAAFTAQSVLNMVLFFSHVFFFGFAIKKKSSTGLMIQRFNKTLLNPTSVGAGGGLLDCLRHPCRSWDAWIAGEGGAKHQRCDYLFWQLSWHHSYGGSTRGWKTYTIYRDCGIYRLSKRMQKGVSLCANIWEGICKVWEGGEDSNWTTQP